MLQKFLLAAAVSAAALVGASQLSVAVAAEATGVVVDQAALDAQVAAVEALVLQYQNDPDGLQAAIETYVSTAADPSLAADAVLFVAQYSTNADVKTALAGNPDLVAALGKGLGAAIATIALTNPELATTLTAKVVATGNASLIASVQSGTDTKTASLAAQGNQQAGKDNGDSTPENPASGS